MKLPILSILVTAAVTSIFAAEGTADLSDQKSKFSYALGVNFGQNLKNQGVEANLDLVRKGIEDAISGKPQMSEPELRETFNQLRAAIQANMEEKKKQNKVEGDKFLAENATKPGILKLESGLQYKVISDGSGDVPKNIDKVEVKYTGKLIDGTVFDTTEKKEGSKPAQFAVTGVIRGWTEALLKMKKGAHWELFIPSELAYGERGLPGIPPNSTLIFDVELLNIIPVTPPPALPTTSQPVTSDIIKVPSTEELKKGAKIEIIKPEDVDKEIAKEKARKEAEEKQKK